MCPTKGGLRKTRPTHKIEFRLPSLNIDKNINIYLKECQKNFFLSRCTRKFSPDEKFLTSKKKKPYICGIVTQNYPQKMTIPIIFCLKSLNPLNILSYKLTIFFLHVASALKEAKYFLTPKIYKKNLFSRP